MCLCRALRIVARASMPALRAVSLFPAALTRSLPRVQFTTVAKIRVAFSIEAEVVRELQKLVAQLKADAALAGTGAEEVPSFSDIAETGLQREIERWKKMRPESPDFKYKTTDEPGRTTAFEQELDAEE